MRVLAGSGPGGAVRAGALYTAARCRGARAAQPAGAPRLPRATAHRARTRAHRLPDTSVPQTIRAHKERQVPGRAAPGQLRPPAAQTTAEHRPRQLNVTSARDVTRDRPCDRHQRSL